MTAPTPIHPPPINLAKAKLRRGEVTLGLFVTMPSVPLMQHLARTSLDWLWIDLEHGSIDPGAMQAMIAATQGTDCAPLVRIGRADEVPTKPVLDAGAFGVIYPMLRTAEDARIAVRGAKYPPEGIRGVGPHTALARWNLPFFDYLKRANDEILTVVQIETQEALENLDAILDVPGIDVAFIAPTDLSMSFGLPWQFDHPTVAAAIDKAERAILKRGKETGMALGGLALDVLRAKALIAKGYRFLALTNDWMLLREGTEALVKGIRG